MSERINTEDLGNITWTRNTEIQPPFAVNSWVNVLSIFPAFFPITFIYVVLIREKDMAPTFRFTVLYITSGCLISVLPTFLLCAYCLIVIYTDTRTINMILCSLIHRSQGVLVDYKSVFFLVSALDRLYVVMYHTVMSRAKFITVQFFFTIPFIIIWCWNIFSGLLENGDICGPTLGSRIPFLSAFLILLSWIYFITSTFLYFYLYRLFQKSRKELKSTNMSTALNNAVQQKAESKLLVSLLTQAILPTVMSTPYIIALIFYHTGNERLLSVEVYQGANAIGYLAYTLMPLAFVVFVKEFQVAARKILGMRVDQTSLLVSVGPTSQAGGSFANRSTVTVSGISVGGASQSKAACK